MHPARGTRGRIGSAGQQGVTTVEYTVVSAVFLLALVAAPNVIPELMEAIKKLYQAFTYAISVSYPSPSVGDI